MKTKISLLLILAITVISFNSCKTEGCMDSDSKNYNAEANVDDGSCQYEGSVVFWYNESTSQDLIDYYAQSLTLYLNGNIIGTYGTNVYFTSAPDCSDQGVVSKTMDLGSVKSDTYQYKVIDDDDYTWWEGSVQINANTCKSIQLTTSDKVINKQIKLIN